MKQQLNQFLFTTITLLFSAAWSSAQVPTIITQPQSQTIIAGSNAVFTVTATGGESSLPAVSTGTLKLWLKADAGVITTNGRISEWRDRSGNVFHAFQSNTNRQPLLITNAVPISGLPAVRFDGDRDNNVGDFLQGTNDIGLSSGYTSFLVYSRADRMVSEQILALIGVPGNYNSVRSYYTLNNQLGFAAWSNDYITGMVPPPNSYRIWTDRLNETKTQIELYDSDGTNTASEIKGVGGLTSPGAGYLVGGIAPDPVYNYEPYAFQGEVAELIYYQGALGETDRLAVESYLRQKYFQVPNPGAGPLTYKWSRNGQPIAGATNTSLVISNVQAQSAGNYSVTVSNSFGGINSSNALLTVAVPPSITAQPQSQTVVMGTNVGFSVSVSGDSPLSFQWQLNGVPIVNATESTYSLASAQVTNAGAYSVVVSNPFGSITSDTVNLTVVAPPTIVGQPQSQVVTLGTNVTFTVVAGGNTLPPVTSGILKLWLKADSGIVLNNGAISEWQDQSGNGNHAIQANTNKQPLLVDAAVPVSGQPVVRFDGIRSSTTGDFLQGSGNLGLSNGFTSFLICSETPPLGSTGEHQIPLMVGIPSQANAVRSYYINSPSPNQMGMAAWQNDYYSGFVIPTNSFHVWTLRLNSAKTQIEFFDTDGSTNRTSTVSTGGLATPGAGYYIGGGGGAPFPANYHFRGDISEAIFFQNTLTDADRLAVENYLKTKYFFTAGTSSNGLSYQWFLNGTNIVGATNASLTLSNVQTNDAGNYSVVITNLAGSITSSNALLTVNIPPTIDTQPQSQEVVQGTNVSFSVTASSASPLSYQWRFNGVGIAQATASTFVLTNAQPTNAGVYSVLVSDGISSVTSSNATLTVDFAPTITGHPQNKTVAAGTNVTFSVTATGYPLSYQWFYNSTTPIAGATNASLLLTGVTTNQAGNYSVVVSNIVSATSSSNAILTVVSTSSSLFEDFEPDIHSYQWSAFSSTVLATNYGGFVSATHALWFGGSGSRFATTRPIDVSSGATVSFYLRLASGSSTVWETADLPGEGIVFECSTNGGAGWTNIGNYNTATFFNWTLVQPPLPSAAQSSSTLFRWRQLTNSGPANDHWALDDIQIIPASSSPSIVTQPQGQVLPVGTNLTLNVLATGQAPLTYQWLFNSSTVLSSTTSSQTLTNVQLSQSGNYSVIISNSLGAVTSAPAVVTIMTPPSISTQPVSQGGIQGSNVSFSVTAAGSAPLSYQWSFNGVAISNATSSTLLLTNIQGSSAGSYSVRVTNAVGSVVSSNASLTIDAFPTILSQPQSQSVIAGTNVSFSIGLDTSLPTVSSGTLRLWLKADAGVATNVNGKVSQWQDQSGQTNHCFQTNSATQPSLISASGIGGKSAIRFNGSVDTASGSFLKGSGDVGLSNAFTSFMVYSMSYAGSGERMPVFVGAFGTTGAGRSYYVLNGEMSFASWSRDYYSGFIIPTNTYRIWTDRMNTNRTLIEFFDSTASTSTNISRTISSQQTPAAGYYVGGFNSLETAGRNFAGDIAELIYFRGSLSESDRLAVENYLKQKYYQSGNSGSVTYQWQFNGTNILGATNSSLTLSNVQPANAGNYSVVVSNSVGATTSANAALTINVPPSITTQPQDQSVSAGSTANFTVLAAGTGPFSYQWQWNSNSLAGATNSSLSLSSVQLTNVGNYRVVVSSSFGTVTSSNAALAINISTVRIISTNASAGSTVSLPIELSALGTENALGFSLSFNPSVLIFDSVEVDSSLTNLILISNTNQLGIGQVGLAVAFSANGTFTAGTQTVMRVIFNVAVTTNALNTSLTFTDSPTTRQVSDANAETLPSLFVNETLSVTAVDLEGDVAPRPNGNRTLSIVDWVQVGRFAAGLDTITNSSEFQRADCAPRSSSGNGSISVTDWVQAGRYATGVDPLTPVGGPASFAGTKKAAVANATSDRIIRIETNAQNGRTNIVSVDLIADGNENAMGFSLAYDPAVLSFISASSGSGASGAILNVNTNQISAGKVGVALALPTGNTFSAGTREVIKLTFLAAANAKGITTLIFTDIPVLREVSDATANTLSASYTGASLTLISTVPLLSINKSEQGISLSWPASASGYVLESSSGFGTNWSVISTNLTTNGQSISTTLPVSEGQKFYRLKQ